MNNMLKEIEDYIDYIGSLKNKKDITEYKKNFMKKYDEYIRNNNITYIKFLKEYLESINFDILDEIILDNNFKIEDKLNLKKISNNIYIQLNKIKIED